MEKKNKIEIVIAIILIIVGYCIAHYYLYLDPSTPPGIGKSEGLLGFILTTIGLLLLFKVALRETKDISFMNPYK